MEEMIGTWNHTRSFVLQAKSKILELDTVITHRDAMTAWKKLVMGLDSTGDGGSGNVSMAPSGSMNVDSVSTAPHSSTVSFSIPSAITQHPKRVREPHASVCKTARLPVKLSELSTNEKLYGACPILEENQETQDPAATISDTL